MANEFFYSACLSVVHPSIDPQEISEEVTSLTPQIQIRAGSERRTSDGALVTPRRTAALSHWLAYLHGGDRIFSGDIAISEFLHSALARLEGNREFFLKMRQNGEVVLRIGWFSESNHSAGVLDNELLRRCYELGLDVELNYYYSNASESPT